MSNNRYNKFKLFSHFNCLFNKYLYELSALIIFSTYCISRILYLDRDLPPWKLTMYQPIDEFYYTIPAFNLFHYGNMYHKIVPYVGDDSSPLDLLQNVMTAITLKLFGNNYYGLRMASVFASIFIFILIFAILKRYISKDKYIDTDTYKKNKIIIIIWLLFMVFDFSFLIAARVAEPTIFRMLAMMILIYVVNRYNLLKEIGSKKNSFLLGFLSCTAVLYVYIYNAFIIPSIMLPLIIINYKKGIFNVIKQLISYIIGSILCVISFGIFDKFVYHNNLVDELSNLLIYKGRVMGSGQHVSKFTIMWMNFRSIFITNFFRFNLPLLLLFLIALPFFVYLLFKTKDNLLLLISSFIFFIIIQSVLVNDYAYRKLIIMYPLVIILITIVHFNLNNFIQKIRASKLLRNIFLIYFLIVVFICISTYKLAVNPKLVGEFVNTAKVNYILKASFALLLLILFLKLFTKLNAKIILPFFIIIMIISNTYLSLTNVYINPSYNYKNIMKSIAPIVNKKIVAGELAYSFRLYNTSTPILNSYKYQDIQLARVYRNKLQMLYDNNIANCTIAYITENNDTIPLPQKKLKLQKRYILNENENIYIGIFFPE